VVQPEKIITIIIQGIRIIHSLNRHVEYLSRKGIGVLPGKEDPTWNVEGY
jgi:hypothetical protein